MSKIAFFCIPAHGHTNPTIEVVRELVKRGNEVCYFSYDEFQEKIEAAGAEFISCNDYDIQLNMTPEDGVRIAKDVGFATKVMVNTTLALDGMVCETLKKFSPDCVIADSMAVWGKFAALKLQIPFISSTTTFAFNKYSARIMKQDMSQLFSMIKSIPSVKKDVKRLQAKGYPVKNLLSMIQNDNDTNTIVYTSKEFQPFADTFSDKYVFVGPSVKLPEIKAEKTERKTVYISLGTVNNRLPDFYRHCIEAFKDGAYDVVMSVGEGTDIAGLGQISENFTIRNRVNQMEVLQRADVFLSHCGMNSVSESLYCKVPLVLFPQTTEQGGVANRVAQLEAGIFLKEDSSAAIRQAVEAVLSENRYKKNAEKIAESFYRSGGAAAAADAILQVIGAYAKHMV